MLQLDSYITLNVLFYLKVMIFISKNKDNNLYHPKRELETFKYTLGNSTTLNTAVTTIAWVSYIESVYSSAFPYGM